MPRAVSADLISLAFIVAWLAIVAATFGILVALVLAAAIAGVLLAMWLQARVSPAVDRRRRDRRVHDRALRISRDHARPLPVPGCRGCELAQEAGPRWLGIHVRSEHRRAA